MDKIPVIILTGPTAVGKTKLSIELAKSLNAEIISADSMQIYRYMDIGSAKISHEEMEGVVHHLIDVVDPNEEFTVSEFKRLATEAIRDIHSRGKTPIVTGGTGLYLNSLIYDMDFGQKDSDPIIREELNKLYNQQGAEYMHDILKSYSEDVASRIHPNNVKRVIRAIEIFKQGGSLGDFSNDLKFNEEFDVKIVVLSRERSILYERINMRVDIMLNQGLIKEVENLHKMGYGKDLVSMKGIGYKEILDYFDGVYDMDRAIELIKQGSRQYAKRQVTWFKRYTDALVLNLDEVIDINEQLKIIKEFCL